jgi:hypothetical protein
MKSKWETAHRTPFKDLMKWHDSILESQKRKEKIMKSVKNGYGKYGLCDACHNRLDDRCLLNGVRVGKEIFKKENLERTEKCLFFNCR